MAALLPALFIGCSEDKKPQKPSGDELTWQALHVDEAHLISIKSLDDMPLEGAQVLIGNAMGQPFSGNFLTTDANGQIMIPREWNEALPLTVSAPGYVRTTYLAQDPTSVTLRLRKLPTALQFEVRGGTQGLPVSNKDGYVDFGLIMPAFTKLDLLSFDMNSVISPLSDRIKVVGGQELNIPANVSLPKQTEKYNFLIDVTLNKPTYRIYFGQPGVTRVYAARGRFEFKPVVQALRDGAQFYDLINHFSINGGGIRDIEVRSNQTVLEMPTTELNYTEKREVMAPAHRGDELFLAVSVTKQSGLLIPTDVKQIAAHKKHAIASLPNSERMVLGVLKKSDEMKRGGDRMSATLLPFEAGITPKMLPLIADPTYRNNELLMPALNTVEGVNPIATYSILSQEVEIQQGGDKVHVMSPLWDVYATAWISSMQLPQWPQDKVVTGKKRWQVNFIGSQTSSQPTLGPAMIEAATHVTHSSVTF